MYADDDFSQKPPSPFFTRHRSLFGSLTLSHLLKQFSPAERLFLYVASFCVAVSVFALLAIINREATTAAPAHGGSYTEGIVGTPRFVNPLLASTDADRDLTALVYSGLMRARPNNELVPDLASSYEVSEDGLHYTFHIRPEAVFHDGTPITAQDVLFTVETAQNPLYKSTKRTDWEGVTMEVVDDHTISFSLPRPYAPFLEATTMGILPKSLWENVAPEDFLFHRLNTESVGSGPYYIERVSRDASGAPDRFILGAFRHFTLGKPYINRIRIDVFGNEEDALHALERKSVEGLAGLSPKHIPAISETHRILKDPLPRVFGVFFNQSKNAVLSDFAVRKALDTAVSRRDIIEKSLDGLAVPATGTIPQGIFSTRMQVSEEGVPSPAERLERAKRILDDAGWKMDETRNVRMKKKTPLSLSIATSDTPELSATADALANTWRAIGVDVSVKIYSSADLNTTVLRPREYDALLFGIVVGRSADVYAFWHSSQRNDPGLNLALYTNVKADKLLSDARKETDQEERERTLSQFEEILREDVPAVFLYNPEFLYVIPEDVYGVSLGALTNAAERFLNVYEWHREKEYVWNAFITPKGK